MRPLAGLASGIGIGIFRVHPLIMTLAVGLVVEGLLLVYQRGMLGVSAQIPEVITWLGTGRSFDIIPNSLLVFVPLAAAHRLHPAAHRLRPQPLRHRRQRRRRPPRGRARVAGADRALRAISALLAGIGGLVYVGLIKATTLSLAVPLMLPSVAAAVIGGTSIFGGRGGYAGTIVGALILQVLASMLTVLRMRGRRRAASSSALIILGVTALYVRITQERQG